MERYLSALTIAGSDPSGGAGLQADLKTFSALGVYGTSAITAVTVQNTVGVKYVHKLPPQVVYDQIETVMEDIHIDAVKIGMVNDAETLDAVVKALNRHKPAFLVVDPVMVSTSGCSLMQPDALDIMRERLLPIADIVTPNIPEACVLAGKEIYKSGEDIQNDVDIIAQAIFAYGVKALLIKGGHIDGKTKNDYLYIKNGDDIKRICLSSETVDTNNTHGTGCTLSSAIAAFAARGMSLEQAVRCAKNYLTEALKAGADIHVGNGHGPVNHFYKPVACLTVNNTPGCKCTTSRIKHYALSGSPSCPPPVNIQFITHFTDKYSYLDSAMMALEGGCRWIQLRMKDASPEEWMRTGAEVEALCRRYSATFILDDHVEWVDILHADGVHLGKSDMPIDEARRLLGQDRIIGGTANTLEDVMLHATRGADYIGCGPFRFTTTKEKLAPTLGLEGYRRILDGMKKKGISLPLIAIGGITKEDIPALMETGVDGIALSGTILRAGSPTEETRNILKILNVQQS